MTENAKPSGPSDADVARLAVSKELATAEEMDRCIRRREKLADKKVHKGLLEVMVEQKVLTVSQAKRLHRDAEKSVQLKIPGYDLLEPLGQGSMGMVYKAKQLSMDRVVAVKVLLKSLAMNKEFINRFQSEARLAAKLNNSHVVQAIDVGEAGGHHFFVMEYVPGTTIKEQLDGGKVFEEEEAVEIIRQVADALRHAHQRGLVHRDVKPENIITATGGVVKLADLGLARQTADERASTAEAGVTIGTPYYISPEQIRGDRDIDGRTDIYSLGATLYHMVTGSVPFAGENPTTVMQRHLRDQLVPPDHLNTSLSNGLGEMVETMMAKDRDDRYADAGDLLIDIDSLRRGEPPMLARRKFESHTLAALAEADDDEPVGPNLAAALGRTQTRLHRAGQTAVALGVALAVSLVVNAIMLLVLLYK